MTNNFQPTVALIYDRANTTHGGAENVLLAIKKALPQAVLYTSFASQRHAPWLKKFSKVKASFWNKLPPLRTRHRWLAALMPLVFEGFDLSSFQIIISVTSAEAKGVITRPDQLHLCYLLTPPRYLYHGRQHSLASHRLLKLPVIQQLAQALLNYLTWWDQAAIFRPDVIIPISKRVGERVKKFYPKIKPDSVIYPPVNLRQSSVITPPAVGLVNYLLVISRLVSHKKIELAIKACDRLGKNLIIVGRGPAKAELLRLAEAQKNTVLFLDQVNQTQLANLYQHCQALLMPGEEDFGIVALEANLFGKPVLINARSGAAELIEPKVHGFHIESETVEAVVLAIEKLATHQFSASQIKRNPLQYGTNTFVKNFARAVDRHWQKVKKDNL